jgi:iron complex transport system permease protein
MNQTPAEQVGRSASPGAWRANISFLLLFVLLFVLILFSLTLGRYPVSSRAVLHILAGIRLYGITDYTDPARLVVEIIRLPRVLTATLCGMGLAMAGAAMQGVFRNPLVEPGIAGVTPGASFGGVLAIMIGLSFHATMGMAFGGGMLALVCTLVLARLTGKSSILSLVLSGMIVGTFFGALVGLMETLASPATKLPSIVYWILGSFANATYPKLAAVAVVTFVAGVPLLLLRWRINLLSLDESDAKLLGVPVEAFRWVIVLLVSLLVAAQVSVSGGVQWVGLIVPHMARMLVGPDHRRLLPAAALLGGSYLLLMDDISRSLGSQEIPIGLLNTVIGAPIFAYLFWKTRGRGWVHG